MGPDTLKRVRVATDIVDNPEHAAWDDIVRQVEADMYDSPLVVLGQGEYRKVITGDDLLGGTGFLPSLEKVARRLCGALLSFLRVRR